MNSVKFRNRVFYFITGCCLLLVSSCYYDKEDELYAEYYANKNCDTVNVTFSQSILPIMEAKCNTAGCHVPGGSGPGDFTGYNGVKSKADNGSLVNRTITLKDMPPGAPLTICEMNKIRKWVEAGAPNN